MPRFLYAVLLLTALSAASAPGQVLTDSCRVAHVVDGDTFNCANGRIVRVLLVDAPDAGRFGAIARSALATLLPVGSTVALETDSVPRDDAGRTLAYVYLADGRMANTILVREGFAFFKPSRENQRYAALLRDAENRARAERRGVWMK